MSEEFTMSLEPEAVAKVAELMAEQEDDVKLRVGVVGGGCSGLNYSMSFVENIEDTDWLLEYDDVKIVVDKMSQEYLNGLKIGYVDDVMSPAFTFDNPSAGASCGCGTSFTPKGSSGCGS